MYHLGSNTDRVDELAEKFARPGEHTIAVDGSGNTVETWQAPALRSKARAMGITEVELGQMTSKTLIKEIVGQSIQESSPQMREKMSVIVDLPHFPAKGSTYESDEIVPKLHDNTALNRPFVNVMAELGLPVFCKGDGEKIPTNHKVKQFGEYKQVWETIQSPEILSGLKTHFLHDGKSAFNTTLAARAAADQAAAALFHGILPMPEPDIDKTTSIDSEKTAKSYLHYYDVLMQNMSQFYPDYKIHELGQRMATKLGPVEDGEHTNGPPNRFKLKKIAGVATDTAALIEEVHKKTGISAFRMLSNGRPLGPMIQLINKTNRILPENLWVGSSFSSSQMKETILRGAPIINPETERLEFENKKLARDFHARLMKVCEDASAGKLRTTDLKDLDIKIAA